jgi:hypothetical protein
VNEVSVPLDENNVPIAPDPNTPTPTGDEAHLRLILHVSGSGQVNLLKDVAILERNPLRTSVDNSEVIDITSLDLMALGNAVPESPVDSDIALVTDERLYGDFPPQPAVRIASAVFDFGDSRATDAVNAVLEAAVSAVTNSLPAITTLVTNTEAARLTAQNNAAAAALTAANAVVLGADVTAAFSEFLRTNFTSATVDAIAAAGTPANEAADERLAAAAVQALSFYSDPRLTNLVDSVVAAVENAGAAMKARVAQNTAASFADVTDNYGRFIAGNLFGEMIDAGAAAAAAAAVMGGADATSIRAAVDADARVDEARFEAIRISVAQYADTRAADAVEAVLDAIIASAVGSLQIQPPPTETVVRSTAAQAGRTALESGVARYPVPEGVPTLDYNEFVASDIYASSAGIASQAAAEAAISETRNNALATLDSVNAAAKAGAANALTSVLSAAARAVRTELPLFGAFGPGESDLNGTIMLPANHPTNPFRHRRHPDHPTGYDITRNITLDFDGASNDPLARSGFGVDRITGTYREEIFGLHKPLGQDPVNHPVGLKVQGAFELNRISLIDRLNAR